MLSEQRAILAVKILSLILVAVSAKGVAKSSGSAEIAKEAEMVAAENFITVSLLSSTLSRELWTKFDSGSRGGRWNKQIFFVESLIWRRSIWGAGAAKFPPAA